MKKILIWTLAVIITLAAAVYQRLTGPTHPKRENIELNGKVYDLKFVRSHPGETDAEVALAIPDTSVQGTLVYRLFPTNNAWTKTPMQHKDGMLTGYLPHQPKAGKIEYYAVLSNGSGKIEVSKHNTIKIRFRGDVPAYVIIPHIIFMFVFMLFANAAGLFAIGKSSLQKKYGLIALILLTVGGMILGPVVQDFAFDEFWAGVPFAWDLTDNKTLIAFIFWIAAVWLNRKSERPVYTIIAAVVTLIIFSIPHSMFGSELNPETGEIIQGAVLFRLF